MALVVEDEIEDLAINGAITGDGEAMAKRVAETCRHMGGEARITSRPDNNYPFLVIRCELDEDISLTEVQAHENAILLTGGGQDEWLIGLDTTSINVSNSIKEGTGARVKVFTLSTDPGRKHPEVDMDHSSTVHGKIPFEAFEAKIHRAGEHIDLILEEEKESIGD